MGSEIGNLPDHTIYCSRFSWRYGSNEMRTLFSEIEYRKIWREIWCQIAEAQRTFGLITQEELLDILQHKEQINIARSQEIERKIRHDLMAELKAFAEQCQKGGKKLHLGATSADIEDNADIIRIRRASSIILCKLLACLKAVRDKAVIHASTACMGWTHLQPAEPTTVGYRLANYAQDLVIDIKNLQWIMQNCLLGKGIRGAVGTSASYATLLDGEGTPAEMEKLIMNNLDLDVHPVSTQTYPRKIDFILLSCLSSIAQSAHKFAFDLRILQSPVFGELSEPFDDEQVGSSAMPSKHNPIHCERVCSLSRFVISLQANGWMNAANSILERTLDDSANRHIVIPEAFLATDEILKLYENVISKLEVNNALIERNLEKFSGFVGTEALLMKLVIKGADRQVMHEKIRRYSTDAWKAFLKGGENPLLDCLKKDDEISKFLKEDEIQNLFELKNYVGDAAERCRNFMIERIDPLIAEIEKVCRDEK